MWQLLGCRCKQQFSTEQSYNMHPLVRHVGPQLLPLVTETWLIRLCSFHMFNCGKVRGPGCPCEDHNMIQAVYKQVLFYLKTASEYCLRWGKTWGHRIALMWLYAFRVPWVTIRSYLNSHSLALHMSVSFHNIKRVGFLLLVPRYAHIVFICGYSELRLIT